MAKRGKRYAADKKAHDNKELLPLADAVKPDQVIQSDQVRPDG